MKKILFCLMAVLAVVAGCVENNIDTVGEKMLTVSAVTEGQADTRTYIGDLKNGVRILEWSKNDKIGVWIANSSRIYELKTANGDGIFEGTVSEDFSAPFYAVYPVNSDVKAEGSQVTMILPETQHYVTGGFEDGIYPMAAICKSNRISFQNLCGVLKINLVGADAVSKIVLTADKPIAGKGRLNMSWTSVPEFVMDSQAGKYSVTLDCGQGVALSDAATAFTFVLPADTYKLGMKIYTNNGVVAKDFSSSVTVKRSIIRTTDDFKVVIDSEDYFDISQTEFNLSAEATEIDIVVKASSGFEYHIVNCDWIKDKTTDAASGKLKFAVAENTGSDARKAIISICSDKGQCYNVSVKQEGKIGSDPEPDAPWLNKTFYHKSLAMRFTATWCGWCPRMNTSLETAMLQKPDKIEYVAMHGGGSDLDFAGTSSLISLYGVTGFPTGMMDGRAKISNYDINTTAGLFVKVLEETEQAYPTMTSTVFSSSINGNTLKVDLELYAKQADKYKITALLLEDGIVGYQANYEGENSNTYVHNNVARLAITDIRGESVSVSDPKTVWKKSYSVTIPSGCNKENLRILVYVQRPYGSQTIAQGVANVEYGDFEGYYVDNANSAKIGVKTEIVYINGGNEHIGMGDPIGTVRR